MPGTMTGSYQASPVIAIQQPACHAARPCSPVRSACAAASINSSSVASSTMPLASCKPSSSHQRFACSCSMKASNVAAAACAQASTAPAYSPGQLFTQHKGSHDNCEVIATPAEPGWHAQWRLGHQSGWHWQRWSWPAGRGEWRKVRIRESGDTHGDQQQGRI